MAKLRKNLIFWFLLFWVVIPIELVYSADSLYKKKVMIKHFDNPLGWTEEYNPGAILSDKLKSAFWKMDGYHLIEFDPKTQPVSPAQFIIQGKILTFDVNPNHTMGDKLSTSAEVGIELEVVSGKTWKPLIKEKFWTSSSGGGRKNFGKLAMMEEPKGVKIDNEGVARAMGNLVTQVAGYVNEIVKNLPFEAMIIAVDKENEAVMISAGSTQGIKVRDRFHVFSLDSGFMDPITKQSLGEKWVRQGVIKIKNVNEHFSEAEIIGGGDFKQEYWVKPRGTSFSGRKTPWWQFHALTPIQ
jgi:hypothetical protein